MFSKGKESGLGAGGDEAVAREAAVANASPWEHLREIPASARAAQVLAVRTRGCLGERERQ